MERPGVFKLLNDTRDLGWPVNWEAPGAPLLWRYNLHYFEDFVSHGAKQREEVHHQMLCQWLAAHPPGARPSWDPYPLSLRIVNWIKWVFAGAELPQQAMDSLAAQARWLAARPEWHLLGNHLFANAKALIFAGCYFTGREAEAWLSAGISIVEVELGEQVLSDGGNFELSPMYHAIFLTDIFDLINLAGRYPHRLPARLLRALADRSVAMLKWLATMSHPDGEIALFNDSALGIAPNLEALRAYARRLGISVPPGPTAPGPGGCALEFLEASGYARMTAGPAVAICDAARIGPDYLPGHAHADTLSFELSIGPHRLVVNGGTSRYGADEVRQCERGTASHSTVIVDGADSSEVWSGFRVARRARPFAISRNARPDLVSLDASHDGYRRLGGGSDHRRQWTMSPFFLRIEDSVSGRWSTATARYILHASVEVEPVSANLWRLRIDGAEPRTVTFEVNVGEGRLEPAWHSLEFGKRLATRAIAVDLVPGEPARVTIAWGDDENPDLH